MDRYTKIVLTIIALTLVVEKAAQLAQIGNVQKITLCTAANDCGVGTFPNSPLIIKNYGSEPYIYSY